MSLGKFIVGALRYADDLTILALSPDALRKMLQTCENSPMPITFDLTTQLICNDRLRPMRESTAVSIRFCSKQLCLAESVIHLGNHLTFDNMDIRAKTAGFVRQDNSVLL